MSTHNREPGRGSPNADAPNLAHTTHERLLITAHAAGDLSGRDLAHADDQLATCPSCRSLHDELRAIAKATHELPAPQTTAPRDFRIAPDQADALNRGGIWRRLLRPFARRGGASRPLALAFTTLGIGGLLLASLPTLQLGGGQELAATAPQASDSRNLIQVTSTPNPMPPGDASTEGIDTMGGSGAPGILDGSGQGAGYGQGAGHGAGAGNPATPAPTAADKATPELARTSSAAAGPPPLILLSVAFLAAGLGLLLLRRFAQRLR